MAEQVQQVYTRVRWPNVHNRCIQGSSRSGSTSVPVVQLLAQTTDSVLVARQTTVAHRAHDNIMHTLMFTLKFQSKASAFALSIDPQLGRAASVTVADREASNQKEPLAGSVRSTTRILLDALFYCTLLATCERGCHSSTPDRSCHPRDCVQSYTMMLYHSFAGAAAFVGQARSQHSKAACGEIHALPCIRMLDLILLLPYGMHGKPWCSLARAAAAHTAGYCLLQGTGCRPGLLRQGTCSCGVSITL